MELKEIIKQFSTDADISPYGNGHINDTYYVRNQYILQRINTSIYSKRILDALGIDGAIRVSPLHCHGLDDIDEFLRITADMAKEFAKK